MKRNPVRLVAAVAVAGLAIGTVAVACSGKDQPGGGDAQSQSQAADDATAPDGQTDPSDGPASPEAVSAEEAITEIEWIDGSGGTPVLQFQTPLVIDDVAARVVAPGDGAELVEGELVSFDFEQFDGGTGADAGGTWGTGANAIPPGGFMLNSDQVEVKLLSALMGQKIGAKVLYIVPSGSGDGSSAGVIALVVTGSAPVLPRAEGEPVEQTDSKLPKVEVNEEGVPAITAAGGEPPAELTVETTIKGEGATVEEGQMVAFHYSGWLWDGTAFDSSWDRGAPMVSPLIANALIEGWVRGLAGQNVGSQVLLVIPPELGYGDEETGDIPPGSTLVFVVDILSAV
jgi:peptidylprolyl isomerase